MQNMIFKNIISKKEYVTYSRKHKTSIEFPYGAEITGNLSLPCFSACSKFSRVSSYCLKKKKKAKYVNIYKFLFPLSGYINVYLSLVGNKPTKNYQGKRENN